MQPESVVMNQSRHFERGRSDFEPHQTTLQILDKIAETDDEAKLDPPGRSLREWVTSASKQESV